jgi:senataxin
MWLRGESLNRLSKSADHQALADLRRRIPDKDLVLQAAFSSTLQVHAKFISRVALRREGRAGAAWDPARSAGQTLLEQCFAADGRDLAASMLGLAQIAFVERRRLKKARGGREAPPPQPVTNLHKASVQGELWRTAYSQVGTADVAGIAIFLKSIATFSHIEILDRHAAWTSDRLKAVIKDEDWVGAVRAINSGLKITREGFAHTLEALAMQPDTTLSRTLWDIPRVAESAVILLLSPIEEIHDPIISLVQQAFDDADDRLDCFRILLQKYPDQAMDGLTIFLAQFIQAAPKTPDACSLAKWLVRCFTDVLEVLCNPSSSEPLLHNEAFLANNAGDIKMSRRVGDLWQLMTESLAIIFDRTKDWAPLYENEVMVDWMRDALIFGRNMTEHTRVFEAAYLNQSGSRFGADAFESPMKIGQVGKKMVEKLEKVLKHLVSWLRLTE